MTEQTMNTTAATPPSSHCACFRDLTRATHNALDKRIMAFNPFLDQRRFTCFLQVQYAFHRDVATLFEHAELNRLLPGLRVRGRLAAVIQDLQVLDTPLPLLTTPPLFGSAIDIPTALGWLYVEEGSNLGGGILFKMARSLGLDAEHGARHLAPHPEGRAPSWRTFMQQLDAIELTDTQQQRAAQGANAAFSQVQSYVERFCPLP